MRYVGSNGTNPMIEYARPSFELSVIWDTHPRATPIAPANTPCIRRTANACGRVVEVPKSAHVSAVQSVVPVDVFAVQSPVSERDNGKGQEPTVNGNESDYLRSKLWCVHLLSTFPPGR